MFVQTRTEIRVVTPYYIENPTHNLIMVCQPGRTKGTVTQAARVKVVALSNGKVSVKGIGKGGFPARHYSPDSRLLMEGERSISLADFMWLFGDTDNGLSMAVIIP